MGWTDWQDRDSCHFSEPRNHALMPGGSEYSRYLWVRERVPGLSRVLDVGCNCGQLALNLFTDLGCRVVGVDVVADFVAHCQQYVPGTFLLGDFGAMPLEHIQAMGLFDVVTALEVIEHDIDIRGFQRNACAALRPGGVLIVTTPHPDSPILGREERSKYPAHVRMWTPTTLRLAFGSMEAYAEIHRDECGRLLSMGAVFRKPG